jgi:ABC-type multidrug transport system fused ATPase/permease subunit
MSIQHIQQGLGGVKDVKLLGREAYLVSQFQVHAVGSAHAARSQTTLQALPRLWLELLAVGGLTALIAIMIGQGKATQDMLPVVALFAAAAFRFLPSVNRVLGAVQGIRYQRPVVDALHGEIQLMSGDVDTAGALPVSFDETLALEGVSFRYPGAEAWALRDVSLTIERGTSVGFVGTSGAGKSTLVDVVLGLLNPDTGAVKIDGRDIRSNLRGWQDQIGYVPQSIFLTDDTLRRNVAFGIPDEQIDESAIEYAVASAQLDSFVKALPDGLDTVVGERGTRLSGGQLQRIGIARALYHNPGVLVMDEATSALDTETERGVMEAVRALRGEKTLLVVAHRTSTVEHCDYVFRLEQGALVP